MRLSLKTIGSAGYRDQWNKKFGLVQVNRKYHHFDFFVHQLMAKTAQCLLFEKKFHIIFIFI